MSMAPVTVCFTYFKSLGPANLEAALYSLLMQDLSRVESIVIVDNNTADPLDDILKVVDGMKFPVPVNLLSFKHGDPTKTHSWSTNLAVSKVYTPWVFFTRADYILDFQAIRSFFNVVDAKPADWDGFVTGNVYHLAVDIAACEQAEWRRNTPRCLWRLSGAEADYTRIDAGVWMTRRRSFDRVAGLDEGLTVWGHAQTHFQYKLEMSGTEFVRIPQVMFYHPQHAGERDINLAHQQLQERGINLKELWARHEGVQPY